MASLVRPHELRTPHDLVVVIDVLRATSTAAVLCDRLGEVRVVGAPGELALLPAHEAGYALFSELKLATEHVHFDNSPVLARDADLGGRMPVLVTTNGTLAIGIAMQHAREVVLASFINLQAVIDHVRRATGTIAVMPAGYIATTSPASEDDGCADAILAGVAGTPFDVAERIAGVRADPRIVRRATREPGLPADLDLCFHVDALAIVPRVIAGSDRWYVATPARTSAERSDSRS